MTYNFDAERWYENQNALLEARRRRGEFDDTAFTEALEEIDRRYEEMIARLDRSFELPR